MPVDTQKRTRQSIGNYDLLEKIADGGMGAVYKGRNWATGDIVAVKVVELPELAKKSDLMLRRFQQEFRAASSLNHPNIVRALDYGTEDCTHFLVMEFIDGESLGDRIERDKRLPEEQAVAIIVQVAEGLERMHESNMVHRDVKPDNILLTAGDQVKLIDLGLVKEVDGQFNLTRAGGGLGTPNFMAPEQFKDAKNANKKCDIYSLAATLYMMVTGELPFGGLNFVQMWSKKFHNDLPAPRSVTPALSESLDRAVRRAMSTDPGQRPNSIRRFVKELTLVPAATSSDPANPQQTPTSANPGFAASATASTTFTPALPQESSPEPESAAASEPLVQEIAGDDWTWAMVTVAVCGALLGGLWFFLG